GHVRPFAHGAGFLQELFYVDVDLLLRTVICHVGDPPCPVAAGQCARRQGQPRAHGRGRRRGQVVPKDNVPHRNRHRGRSQHRGRGHVFGHRGQRVVCRRRQVHRRLQGGVEQLGRNDEADGQNQKRHAGRWHPQPKGQRQHRGGRGRVNAQVALGAQRLPHALESETKAFGQRAGFHRGHPVADSTASSLALISARDASSSCSYPSRCRTPWTSKNASSRPKECPYSAACRRAVSTEMTTSPKSNGRSGCSPGSAAICASSSFVNKGNDSTSVGPATPRYCSFSSAMASSSTSVRPISTSWGFHWGAS